MKTLKFLATLCWLSTTVVFAGNMSEADQKWKAAVEKIISAGPATISTPSENRAQIVKELAQSSGRKYEVEKTEAGYRIKVL